LQDDRRARNIPKNAQPAEESAFELKTSISMSLFETPSTAWFPAVGRKVELLA
jgi:hypothetical protein